MSDPCMKGQAASVANACSSGEGSLRKPGAKAPARKMSWADKWARTVARTHPPINRALIQVATSAARRPVTTLVIGILVAASLMTIGFFANFRLGLNNDIWSPKGSRSKRQADWLETKSGYPPAQRYLQVNVDAKGKNALTVEGVRRVFEAMDLVRSTPEYDALCSPACDVSSITRFWHHSLDIFESQVQTDEDVKYALSQPKYPDGTPVSLGLVIGNAQYETDQEIVLQSGDIFLSSFSYDPTKEDGTETENLEPHFIDQLWDMRNDWEDDSSNPYQLTFFTQRSFDDEVFRGIKSDIPLVALVFVLMAAFTAAVFYQRDPVQSRTMMGIGAVVTVMLSIMTGYGLMFLCGVPLTPLTQLLPFVIIGIGLDDSFIITGSFYRTNPSDPTLRRVYETLNDVGVTIFLTTLTSTLAFALGCLSSVPGVYWLCLYAFPTIAIDFVYQLTFFIAILVLDERRVQANRRDGCCCMKVKKNNDEEGPEKSNRTGSQQSEATVDEPNASPCPNPNASKNIGKGGGATTNDEELGGPVSFESSSQKNDSTNHTETQVGTEEPQFPKDLRTKESIVTTSTQSPESASNSIQPSEGGSDNCEGGEAGVATNASSRVDRFMTWYANQIVRPWVRICVVLAALGVAGGLAYSTSLMKQHFSKTSVLPSDSYIFSYIDSVETYNSDSLIPVQANFRFVDQSLPSVQEEMKAFVDDLVDMKQIANPPGYFWLHDFETYLNDNPTLQNVDFREQIASFMNDPVYSSIYKNDLAIDEASGNLTASRTWMFLSNMDPDLVPDQMNALLDQQAVARSQSINQGRTEWAFFSINPQSPLWEFLVVAVDELILATCIGVASVTMIGLIFIPHWSAALFILPTMIVLYIDLLGFIRLMGIDLNAPSYFACVMSIGLLVDFVLHVLFRYYELPGDRVSRTKEMLRTIGSSVFLGGITTFLGILPLALTSNPIFYTIFATCLGMVLLGLSHALIVLPVVLATIGPEGDSVPIRKGQYGKDWRTSFGIRFSLGRRKDSTMRTKGSDDVHLEEDDLVPSGDDCESADRT